jgi:capsular polysaccharide export protein
LARPSVAVEGLRRQRHFLFVAAPFGPFSRRLGRALRATGARCTRVILNGGDVLDWGLAHAATYRGGARGWRPWIARHIAAEHVTDLVVYGDSNPYCVTAMEQAWSAGIRVHVLEQGYFRPNWITLERNGVNGSSKLSRNPDACLQLAKFLPETKFVDVGRTARAAVGRIIAYHVGAYLAWPAFPGFRFAYQYSALRQGLGHFGRFIGQLFSQGRDQKAVEAILAKKGAVFLALLQRPGDSQLVKHSSFRSVCDFIETVVRSFAEHAPPDARLVFKCHPLDHGLENHRRTVRDAATAAGVADRVVYLDGGYLPDIVEASAGVISVNSTGGLISLELGRPTITLGLATYDICGVTHQSGLDGFWTRPQQPNEDFFRAFRRVEMASTQVNGAFATSRGIALAVPEVVRRLTEA